MSKCLLFQTSPDPRVGYGNRRFKLVLEALIDWLLYFVITKHSLHSTYFMTNDYVE